MIEIDLLVGWEWERIVLIFGDAIYKLKENGWEIKCRDTSSHCKFQSKNAKEIWLAGSGSLMKRRF